MTFLTIGIPTFNRIDAVSSAVRFFLSSPIIIEFNIKLLVSDNASSDGTYSTLSNEFGQHPNFRIVRNRENLGISKNIENLFNCCVSEYLIGISDEDLIDLAQIPSLMYFLRTHKPSFVSPQFLRDNTIYRGKKSTRDISPSEWLESAFYWSGTIYRVNDCRNVIAKYNNLLHNENLFYYQNLLVALLMSSGKKCSWWNKPLSFEVMQLPTVISVSDDNPERYWHFSSRWKQHIAVNQFLERVLENTSSSTDKHIIIEMLNSHRSSIIPVLRHAVNLENPDLLPGFNQSVVGESRRIITAKIRYLIRLGFVFMRTSWLSRFS